jgi:carnosine synthase
MGGNGSVLGCAGNPCFAGIAHSSQRSAKVSQKGKVATLEEALKLGQHFERKGSWEPSWNSPSANVWATPVPHMYSPPCSVELVIEDLDSDVGSRRKRSCLNNACSQKLSKFEVEQLVCSPGSLPVPMDTDRRESTMRELQPTATYEMLAQVPHEFLEMQGPDAQNLRRSLVRGATVVFISAGYPGKRFIFECAAALGIKSVILDHPDSWSRQLVSEGIVAKFIPVDMSQSSEDVYRQASRRIRQLGEDGLTGSADAVTTFVELSVPLAARLCESFGLPGFRPSSVDAARDKHKTRAALKQAGLPTPRNFLVKQREELQEAGQVVGFPAVLKPVSGAASLGVKKVTSMQELATCYEEVVRELSSLVVSSGALVKREAGVVGVDASNVVDLTVLLEQYLDGVEVDVDIVLSEGGWQYAAVSDNGPTIEPYFNETWGLCPSRLLQEQQRSLKDLAVKSLEALGFTSGVFHVECKYTSTGPHLIEVNARMGGGPVRECNRLVWGVDLVEEAIFLALGIPSRPVAPTTPNTCIAYSFVNARESGKLLSTDSILALRSRDDVISADPLVQPGAIVVGPSEGMPTWLALLVVEKRSSQAALDLVLKLDEGLPVKIVADGQDRL